MSKTKKISGEVLSRLLYTLQRIDIEDIDSTSQINEILTAELNKVENVFCDIEIDEGSVNNTFEYTRLSCFDDASYSKLDVMLPWTSYLDFNNGHSMGTPWSSRKRAKAQPFPDSLIVKLNERIPLHDLSILEVGCYEGHHSASMAMYSNDVWAIDGRIENVIKTLVRTWVCNCEDRVKTNLVDLEKYNLQSAMRNFGRIEPFDLIYHRVVLYHLSHPVQHLKECATICQSYLYLHTQIASNDAVNMDITVDNSIYRVYQYKEPKVSVSPFSGITSHAYWLTQESLIQALEKVGFRNIETLDVKEERNGPRIELIASK